MFEAMAVFSLFFGALVLMFGGVLPIINPGFMESALRRDSSFGAGNAFAIILGISILAFAKWCSRIGRRAGSETGAPLYFAFPACFKWLLR